MLADGIDTYLPGRAERVSGDTGPTVYVDFGHSADAFRSTLEAVNRLTTGRTIMVMGASGDRDTTKRHDMGRVAADGSDVLIVTDVNPGNGVTMVERVDTRGQRDGAQYELVDYQLASQSEPA